MSKTVQSFASTYFSAAVMYHVDQNQNVDPKVAVKYPSSKFVNYGEFMANDGEVATKSATKQKVFSLDAENVNFINSLNNTLISELKEYGKENEDQVTFKDYASSKSDCFIKALEQFSTCDLVKNNRAFNDSYTSFSDDASKLYKKMGSEIDRLVFATGKTTKIDKKIVTDAISAFGKLLFKMAVEPATNLLFINTKTVSKIPASSIKSGLFNVYRTCGINLTLIYQSLAASNGFISEKEIAVKKTASASASSDKKKKGGNSSSTTKAVIADDSESESDSESEDEKPAKKSSKKKATKTTDDSSDEESE